jgi:penicillin-binding protein 2
MKCNTGGFMKDNKLYIQKRIIILGLMLSSFLIVLICRILYIQVIKGNSYALKAVNQRKAIISIEDIRGNILDRNGIPFTNGNELCYVIIFPGMFPMNNDILISSIQNMTCLSDEELQSKLNSHETFIKLKIVKPNQEVIMDIEQNKFSGTMILYQRQRYSEYSLARHLIGYIQKSDNQPVMGIEKMYDKFLNAGTSRIIYAIKDAKNHVVPGFGYKVAQSPKQYYHVRLTLDYYIQDILEAALDQYPGRHGGVVVDVETGEILALASRPHYDQNDPSASMGQEDSFWAVPMKAFPPGSIFKIVVAAAALESGLYSETSPFFCPGGIDIYGGHYSCHPSTGGLGELTLREAFAHSCNDTFIKIAANLGGKTVIDMARKMGLEQPVEIGLDNDPGSLPEKNDYLGPGIGNLAIGQGKVMVTPLQVADILTTIANEGCRKPLKLFMNLISSSGEVTEIPYSGIRKAERIISETTAQSIKRFMSDVTEYGSGQLAKDLEIGGTAGKTGTPQISGDPYTKHYGWFAGFFPLESPRYVVVIMSREEGTGGETAAPIFKDVAHRIWEYENSIKLLNP